MLWTTTPARLGKNHRAQSGARIHSRSLAAAGATVLLAQGFQSSMAWAIRSGQTAGWLTAIIAGAATCALYWITAGRLGRGQNLIDLAREALGLPGAILTALFTAGVLVFHTGLVVRETSEMAVSSIFPHTPETFVMMGLLICTLAGALGHLPGLVRYGRALLPTLVFSIVVVLVFAFGWGRVGYLLPLWGPGPLLLPVRSLGFMGFYGPVSLFWLVGARQVGEPAGGRKAVAAGLLGASLLLAMIKVVLIMTYPLPLGYAVTFPLHELTRIVTAGRFFERVDALWLAVWILAGAAHTSLLLQTAATAYTQALGLKHHAVAVLPLLMLVVTAALFPPDQSTTMALHQAYVPYSLSLAVLWPSVLALIAVLRRRWRRRGA